MLCAAACTDVTSDPSHCGSCGRVCSGVGCSAGACGMSTLATVPFDSGSQRFAANASTLFWTSIDWAGPYISGLSMAGAQDGGASSYRLFPDLGSGTIQWIVADANNVYFSANFGAGGTTFFVEQVPVGGGTPVTIANAPGTVQALAINSTTVFYATQGTGTDTIWSVPIGGGAAPTPIVTGQPQPLFFMAADDNNVYWAQPQAVMQATVAGAGVKALATSGGNIGNIVLDAANVYYSDPNAIFAVPIGGGMVKNLGEPGYPIMLDATDLYFVRNGSTATKAFVRMQKGGGPQVVLAATTQTVYWAALGPDYVYAMTDSTLQQTGVILETTK